MSVIGKMKAILGLDSSNFVGGANRAKQANEELNLSIKKTKEQIKKTKEQMEEPLPSPPVDPKNPLVSPKPAQDTARGFNGLRFQIQQVARELPAIAYGPQVFFAAISNNLPMLTDEVARAKKEYEELAAAGKKATPVWRQMVSSILSWQTALVVGITLLVVYGKEIGNFVSELFKGKKAFDAAEVAASNFHRVMTEGVVNAANETTKLDLLYKAATDNKKSYEDRKTAAEELQSIYPAYFGNLATEQIMIGDAVDKYNDLRTAIVEASKARAAYEMSVEMQKDIDVIEKAGISIDRIRELTKKLKETENKFESTGSGKGRSELLQRFGSEGLLNVRSNLKKIISETRRELNSLEGEVKDSLLKSYGGEEVWERIKKQTDGNVLNYYDGLKASIKKNEEKALASLVVETPDDLNEKAKEAGKKAGKEAEDAYKSTLAYAESENTKAIAALEKEQGAYGTTLAYMKKMLQLRREQETYAKSEAEYQQRKKVNDELEQQIELIEKIKEQPDYAPGSEADLKAQVSALQENMSKLDPIADALKIQEATAKIDVLNDKISRLPQNLAPSLESIKNSLSDFDLDNTPFFNALNALAGRDAEIRQLNDEIQAYTAQMDGATEAEKRYLSALIATNQARLNALDGIDAQSQSIEELSGTINSIIESGVENSLAGIGEALGNLATDNTDNIASTLLSPIADMLMQLGQLAISTGISIEAIKKSFKSFSGIGAIAAGVALVALAAAVKSAVGGMPEQSPATSSGYNTFTGGGYSPGYSNNGAYKYAAANVASAATNVTVDVKGALKGEDIALAVKKVSYNKSR